MWSVSDSGKFVPRRAYATVCIVDHYYSFILWHPNYRWNQSYVSLPQLLPFHFPCTTCSIPFRPLATLSDWNLEKWWNNSEGTIVPWSISHFSPSFKVTASQGVYLIQHTTTYIQRCYNESAWWSINMFYPGGQLSALSRALLKHCFGQFHQHNKFLIVQQTKHN